MVAGVAEQPPPPQVSPDGKFYWDGQRWVPMQATAPAQPLPMAQQQQPLPSGYEIKKKGHFWRNGLLGCVGIIALIIFIPFCAGLAGISTNSSNSSQTTSSSTSPGPSPVPRHVVTESGQGSKIITPFHLGQGNYKVTWTAQGHDNFIVHINLGDQSQHLVNEIPPTPASGEVLFDSPQEADYILDVQASTLSWSITFTPI
jgi:hypothetical protein